MVECPRCKGEGRIFYDRLEGKDISAEQYSSLCLIQLSYLAEFEMCMECMGQGYLYYDAESDFYGPRG